MATQSLYRFGRDAKPEEQFVRVLKERKLASLARARLSEEGALRRDNDLVVRVALAAFGWVDDPASGIAELRPSVWRRVSCSGNLSLQQLHDRVLGPVQEGRHKLGETDMRAPLDDWEQG